MPLRNSNTSPHCLPPLSWRLVFLCLFRNPGRSKGPKEVPPKLDKGAQIDPPPGRKLLVEVEIKVGSRVIVRIETFGYADKDAENPNLVAPIVEKGWIGQVIEIGGDKDLCHVRLDEPPGVNGVEVWILRDTLKAK
jgi:hypothetical protein